LQRRKTLISQKIVAGFELIFVLLLAVALLVILPLTLTSTSQPQTGAAPRPQTYDYKNYLPIIYNHPTPTPPPILYYDNFSNNRSGWPVAERGSCQSAYVSGVYGTLAATNEQCYRSAPSQARHPYGTFQVQARQYSGSATFAYGLYLNGQGDNRYLVKLEFQQNNFCEWQLIRRQNGSEQTIQRGNCRSASNGYNQFNTLRVSHPSGGQISISLNNQPLASYVDTSPLTGQETGLYISEESDDKDVIVLFDNFTIYRP
jgi:hypothetical protein